MDYVNNKGLLADGKNLALLRLLEINPRAPISQLARRVGMSDPAVKERILRLEESGIPAGYRLELNPKELGYQVTAFVRVRPITGHLNKIVELAQTIPEITECHRVTGEDCFILKLFLKELSHLDRVLDKFLTHGQTITSIVQSSPAPPEASLSPRKRMGRGEMSGHMCHRISISANILTVGRIALLSYAERQGMTSLSFVVD